MLDAARLGFRAIAGEGVVLANEPRVVGREDLAQGAKPRMIRARARCGSGILGKIDAELILPLSRHIFPKAG